MAFALHVTTSVISIPPNVTGQPTLASARMRVASGGALECEEALGQTRRGVLELGLV